MILTLIEKEHLVDNVWAFRFESSKGLSWVPGQFIHVELAHDNPDNEGTKRWFTISSAPFEKIIQITTRVTGSTFKQALSALPIGGTIDLLDPVDGDFVWQQSDLPIVLVAGGIGITPFRSMLRQRFHDQQSLNATLVYAGRDENLPFKEEIGLWTAADPALKVHYVFGRPLTAAQLAELVPGLDQSLVYVSGPEPMVEALGDQLLAQGLPKDQLRQDFFPHYDEHSY